MEAETIDHGSVPTEIYRRLRDRILRGNLRVGDQIKIDAVAKEFGVSIIPVREAMRILAADHLVELPPRRSPVVSGLSPDDVLEINRIRCELEPVALSEAIPRATDADFDACEPLIEAARNEALDLWERVDINRRFHLTLYAPCRMQRLLKIISDLYDGLTLCAHFLVIRAGIKSAESREEHAKILRACRRRDVAEAVERLRNHLDAAHVRFAQAIEASKDTNE